ncbi:MAG: hypothetical protein QG597_708 [Actinomycetota bacterium]|jgi:hypothetical protein|nr:hypothetical protein [Actinomycetota bacterium]
MTKALGGGSGAVASSSHAACARFRGTDPLITGVSRRGLAKEVGFADEFGGIPDARWMRARTFERLVRDAKFASEVTTTAVGRLGLDRPTAVSIVNARINVDRTADLLADAHERAMNDGVATLIHELAVPFIGFEGDSATNVKPDFAIVAPKVGPAHGSWLIVGDAKDYERVRSRIDDSRILKGFLQVALGAESAAAWSRLPNGMDVHLYGVLAVPRNAFLQPEAIVEDLHDHREEVRQRVDERVSEAEGLVPDPEAAIAEYVGHLEATFDPDGCSTCTLFSFCRQELRDSTDPIDLLVEIGVAPAERHQLTGLVDGTGVIGQPSPSTRARVLATVSGAGQPTGQRRIDPAGEPGTINVCIAKSDSAALGVYGMATRRIDHTGSGEWTAHVFDDPQSDTTRRAIMKILGTELLASLKDQRKAAEASQSTPLPVHIVVPDAATADVLTSIADTLAGVDLSRLRWKRDKEMGRPALTFNGEPATVPRRLTEVERRGVSFLLEEDRARALTLRSPIVDLRAVLGRHLIAGGPASNALRLDYLVPWTQSSGVENRHRVLSDEIEAEVHTPGARLTNRMSNAIHGALVGDKPGQPRPADPGRYADLIREELDYKTRAMDAAIAALAPIPASALRAVHRTIEGDAQEVWRRRLDLHASDLVRFGRTGAWWRNALVEAIDADTACSEQLRALANPQAAREAAIDAGTRHLAMARVVSTAPLVLEVDSRRIGVGDRIVLLHVNDQPCIEAAGVSMQQQKGSFKFTGLSIGPLTGVDGDPRQFTWAPDLVPTLHPGDELVIAAFNAFSENKSNRDLPVTRPKPDAYRAPTPTCTETSYDQDPTGHQFCCRSHEAAEAEASDALALRRANGELNPQTWPPIIDADAFEVLAHGAPVGNADETPATSPPDDVTADDLD